MVQIQSQAKSSGIKLLEVHGVGKSLDLHTQPKKQITRPISKGIFTKKQG